MHACVPGPQAELLRPCGCVCVCVRERERESLADVSDPSPPYHTIGLCAPCSVEHREEPTWAWAWAMPTCSHSQNRTPGPRVPLLAELPGWQGGHRDSRVPHKARCSRVLEHPLLSVLDESGFEGPFLGRLLFSRARRKFLLQDPPGLRPR